MQVEGNRGPGRPKMTWRTLTERDRREWKFNEVDPSDRDVWRSNVRFAMHAASSYLEGSPLMWIMHLHVSLTADDDDDEEKNPSSAHLSRRLTKLAYILWCSTVVNVVHNFQRSSPKVLGQSKPNFMWSLQGKGDKSLYK